MNSPLKWAGSKRWHVDRVRQLWRGERVVEPFCGGCSISLGLETRAAAINDTIVPLVNFWNQLRNGNFSSAYVQTLDPRRYLEYRELFNCDGTAEHFYAMNRWCFSGIYRVNKAGRFNVPSRATIHPLPGLHAMPYQALMRDWTITVGDFEDVTLRRGDLLYADPPYDDGFTYGQDFSWDDQQRLALWLSIHDGPTIAMNKATERILKLYHALGFFIEIYESDQKLHRGRGRTDTVLEMMATRALDQRVIID